MNFGQFISFQTLHFITYLFAGFIIGSEEGWIANLAFNFIIFFFGSLIMTVSLKNIKNLTLNVLSVTLSFNTMTYLLAFALYIPLPGWKLLALDYLLVTVLSLLGVITGSKLKPPQAG